MLKETKEFKVKKAQLDIEEPLDLEVSQDHKVLKEKLDQKDHKDHQAQKDPKDHQDQLMFQLIQHIQ